MQLRASAPGSIMLLGEYGVLHGKHALVCAIDKRITVSLTPRDDELIQIKSALGQLTTPLQEIQIGKPFNFVLSVLKQFQGRMKQGCSLDIDSDFSDTVGLGSSAAVTVATLSVMVAWLNIRISPVELIRQGRNVVRDVQGQGSGADIAASVYGGIIGYQAQPLSTERFTLTYPLAALYSGFKTPTADAIQQVQTHFQSHPNLFRQINHSIGQCALEGMHVLRQENWKHLGEIMNIQQGMMESLGVSTPLLHAMVTDLRKQSGIIGAKISGAGLGDCVIGLGEVKKNYKFTSTDANVSRIPLAMSLQGVQCEKT